MILIQPSNQASMSAMALSRTSAAQKECLNELRAHSASSETRQAPTTEAQSEKSSHLASHVISHSVSQSVSHVVGVMAVIWGLYLTRFLITGRK